MSVAKKVATIEGTESRSKTSLGMGLSPAMPNNAQ
jgi:hypothetical protein